MGGVGLVLPFHCSDKADVVFQKLMRKEYFSSEQKITLFLSNMTS